MPDSRITVLVLARNEEMHIRRCVESAMRVSSRVVVVDSESDDRTVDIAQQAGAQVYVRPWPGYAAQLNWAIDMLVHEAEWILRLDADEFLDNNAVAAIKAFLGSRAQRDASAATLKRRFIFCGKPVRYGGVGGIRVLRLFRPDRSRCESRLMDEHIVVEGAIAKLDGFIVDHSLHALGRWIEKHNQYASLEAVQQLLGGIGNAGHAGASLAGNAKVKRFLKDEVYSRLPASLRAQAYYFYRYWLLCGFIDSWGGNGFHFFQAYWYRRLVDEKVNEVRRISRERRVPMKEALIAVFGEKLLRDHGVLCGEVRV